MSKRHHPGEKVSLKPCAGMSGPDHEAKAIIPSDYEPSPCILGCGDPKCREWPVVIILDEKGRRTEECRYHVSECEMF